MVSWCNNNYYYFIINKWRNIITCINSFYFGMIFVKFRKIFFTNQKIFIFSFFVLILLCLYRIIPCVLIYQIQGFALYIVLVQFGQYIMCKKFSVIFGYISSISYYIYLCHHRIILDVLSIYNPIEWYFHLVLLGLTILLIIINSKIVNIIINSIIKSKAFQKLELLILN